MREYRNLDRAFNVWYYEETYPVEGSNRSTYHMNYSSIGIQSRDYWMRMAYKEGARAMASITIETLGAWACACSGLDPELITPDEIFDRAMENLGLFYGEQLEMFDAQY